MDKSRGARQRTLIGSQLLALCFGTGDAIHDMPCSGESLSDGETDEARCSGRDSA